MIETSWIEASCGLNFILAVVVVFLLLQLKTANLKVGYDPKTGVNWFSHLTQKVEKLVERARQGGQGVAVAMLDLDRFKQINDTYGHQRGDRVLRELCQVILAAIRPLDMLTRYGGEEFLIAFVLENGAPGALEAAERVRNAIEEHTFDGNLKLTVSVGLAVCPGNGTGLKDLVEQADKSLYKAKRNGRNQVVSA